MYSDAIQKLYVAYFNRPADVGGLAYWEKVIAGANGSTAALSAEFARSTEYQKAYAGMSNYQLVAQVYLNLFGHSPDAKGLDFWAQALENKQMTVADVVTQIASGAQGTDVVAFNSKAAGASAFTAALDTVQEALAYSGDVANQVAKNFLSTIVDEATMKAATTPEALQKVIDSMSHGDWMPLSYILVPGKDFYVGTFGDDVFTALAFDPATGKPASTLSPTDYIDGGPGQDVLNIEIQGGHNASFGTIMGFETVNIHADAATPIDASLLHGATLIKQTDTAGAVTNLGPGATAAFVGSAINGALSVAAAGAAASVSFSGVSDRATLAVSGAALASVTVSGTRVHSGAGELAALALHVTAGKDVASLSINTTHQAIVTLAETSGSSTHLGTLDATASTAGITLDAAALANVASIKTGAGNDVIIANKQTGQSLSVLAGDGDDIVLVNGKLAAGDVIDGGAGNNTLVLTAAGSAALRDPVLLTVMKNFATTKFIDTIDGLDASLLGPAFSSISLASGSAVTNVGAQMLVAHGDLNATAAAYAAGIAYGGNLQVTEASSGTLTAHADALDLSVEAGSSDVRATLVGDLRTARISLVNSVDDPSQPHTDAIASVTIATDGASLPGLSSISLSGNGSASITNTNGAKLAIVDASALGGTLVAGSGATNGLTYSSTNSVAETIRLGSGIDRITIGASTYDHMDTISGLQLTLNTAGSALAADTDKLDVTGVASTVKIFTTTQTSLDLALVEAAASAKGDDMVFTFGGDTYIYHDSHANNVLDGDDIVVKLTGTVDLKALILALGGTPG